MKQNRLTVKLDPHTFGGSKASEKLSKVLNEQHPELVAKVGGFYHKFTAHLNSCVIAAPYFQGGGLCTMMELYKQHKLAIIQETTMPDIIKSLFSNVVLTAFKVRLSSCKASHKS